MKKLAVVIVLVLAGLVLSLGSNQVAKNCLPNTNSLTVLTPQGVEQGLLFVAGDSVQYCNAYSGESFIVRSVVLDNRDGTGFFFVENTERNGQVNLSRGGMHDFTFWLQAKNQFDQLVWSTTPEWYRPTNVSFNAFLFTLSTTG